MTNEEIRQQLYSLKDEKYRQFSMKLLSGIENILGVPIPYLRRLSKKIDYVSYFSLPPSIETFEEVMLQGMVIGNIKDIEVVFPYILDFLPLINNWSICDSFCSSLKITKKYPKEMWKFLKPLWERNNPFILRFCLVMSLQYFINDKYIDKIFNEISKIKNEEYYVLMALAWLLSIIYKTYPDRVKHYLQYNCTSSFVYQKTIQKILELKNISLEEKQYFKKLKTNKSF